MNLIGLSKDEFRSELVRHKVDTNYIQKIWTNIYSIGIKSFNAIPSLNCKIKSLLEESFSLDRLTIVKSQISNDGTIKWLIKLNDYHTIETVYIPENNRGTLCVSSQVGCILNCAFCYTGTQKLARNLTANEIIQQVIIAKDVLNDWPSSKLKRKVSNIVFMGMGEPLYNYDNVSKAIKIIMANDGIGISRRRITISTAGVVPYIERCANELKVNLAVSLHASTNELRNKLVPLNRKYSINKLIDICKKYQVLSNSRRITFEYTMLKGINDSINDANMLINLISNIHCTVNLIPFNSWQGSDFQTSDLYTVSQFSQTLFNAGIYSPVRTTRGQDIMAACGQLKSASGF